MSSFPVELSLSTNLENFLTLTESDLSVYKNLVDKVNAHFHLTLKHKISVIDLTMIKENIKYFFPELSFLEQLERCNNSFHNEEKSFVIMNFSTHGMQWVCGKSYSEARQQIAIIKGEQSKEWLAQIARACNNIISQL